jgi:TonB-dependent SusC/RagA subfamily outer membrane receptor
VKLFRSFLFACAIAGALPAASAAQMTLSGRVTAGDRPVEGASVSIRELNIESRTNADGRYSFIIRSAQVFGQTVPIVASHRSYGSQTVRMQIIGGSAVQDFVLSTAPPRPAPGDPRTPTVTGPARIADTTAALLVPRTVDSSAIAHTVGPLDVGSALAGRIAGLTVMSAATPGGSAPMFHRGPRTLVGAAQPLVVVDDVPIDNVGFATAMQRFGLGGFDFGTPLQDIALDDVASVTLLDGASATLLYGARAANGVLQVATKRGVAGSGLRIAASTRFTMESQTRIPEYQSRFGQGLGGAFEFFDGMGGGINDAVDQSWGPEFLGQPISQASLTEPRRPDVRFWRPGSAIGDYFQSGRTFDVGASLLGSNDWGSVRGSLNSRSMQGVSPRSGVSRDGATLNASVQPLTKLVGSATFQIIRSNANERPGTGFDEINPVAGFTRFGRQVDLAALRANIRDTAEQINWIYTQRNNPFFQPLVNTNDDDRVHLLGGVNLHYSIASRLTAALRVATSDYDESRNFAVESGWKGGYPTAFGRGSFVDGGTQAQTFTVAEKVADLSVTAGGGASGLDLSGTLGVEARDDRFRASTSVTDRAAASGPPVQRSEELNGESDATSIYAMGSATRGDYLTFTAGARMVRSSSFQSSLGSALFPAFSLGYDVAKQNPSFRDGLGLGSARLHASWWRSGSELGPRALSRTYAGGGSPTSPISGVVADSGMLPERTTGIEIGVSLSRTGGRASLDVTYYVERSSELLIARPGPGSETLLDQTGEISNKGFETQLRLVPLLDGVQPRWEIMGSFARNVNEVEELANGVNEVALGPPLWGAWLAARKGSPLGTILGTRYLRNSSGQLLLRNGLPMADASGALAVLGSWQPDWTMSVQNRLRIRGAELMLLVEARMGGEIFSATNLWGSYAGTLESTLEGRDTSLVIAGVDSLSGAANATEVSAEDYFHALGGIHEAWVFDASFMKLREARLTYELPLTFLRGFRDQTVRVSLVGRNLLAWAKAPNIDPETALSVGVFQGFEMGQLPTTRSIGVQLSITP